MKPTHTLVFLAAIALGLSQPSAWAGEVADVAIPMVLFMDTLVIRLAAESAAVFSVLVRRPRPASDLPPVLAMGPCVPRIARSPAQRFIPCHRVSVVLP